MSTAFDLTSIEELHSLAMERWKVPSGEVTNRPYLEAIAKLGRPIILSTGMASMEEIAKALSVLRENGSSDIIVLHCTTEYPAPYDEINLRAMLTLKSHFGLPVGYSDHSEGIEVAIAAVALGAQVIEKHFTLDRNMNGPDHKASLEPVEFARMVKSIRHIEAALGDGIKQPTRSEMTNRQVARKSIVAKRDIRRGELFTNENLTTKRPENGISPMKWHEIVGRTATRDYMEDDIIVSDE